MISDYVAPTIKRVRAYFAPVDRVAEHATLFDPAQNGTFAFGTPPKPWVDLGWITDFERVSEASILPVRAGSPASAQLQVRSEVEARVLFKFESWGKLQLSLSAGTQQMNLLRAQSGAALAGSGGTAMTAEAIAGGSTASVLQLDPASAAAFAVGDLLAADVDYLAGTTGFVGSGVSGAYVRSALADVDYVRRVTLNVGRVSAIANGAVSLEQPLLAGTPVAGMKVSPVVGFCDREGSTFFQEWSALFVGEGQQGERVLWHYPRLQAMAGIGEDVTKGAGEYRAMRLKGSFRALPVTDAVDGERVLCFRSYIQS